MEGYYEITTAGGRLNTKGVVELALRMKDSAREPYDSVWAVFDKDDFPADNFNGAIIMAQQHGIGCAWSNQAFELWFLLHFQNRVTAMPRGDYKKAISKAVAKHKKDYEYAKNTTNTYSIMRLHGNQAQAITRARALHAGFGDEKFHEHNPCTTVYKLVEQLIGKDTEFNKKVSEKMEEIQQSQKENQK